jgi:hypothetical protein
MHHRPRYLVLAVALAAASYLLPSPGLATDEITNVAITKAGEKYIITYDLESGVPGFVDLLGSSDGGKTFDILMEHVTGDVGRRIPPGRNFRIVWDAGRDLTDGLEGQDIVVYPAFSFRKREYQEQTEIEAVQSKVEYQEALRREREAYAQWIIDNEDRLQELVRERTLLQDRLSGLQMQTPLLLRSAASDKSERKRAERAEKNRAREIESLQDDLLDLDKDIDALRNKIRQLRAERGALE